MTTQPESWQEGLFWRLHDFAKAKTAEDAEERQGIIKHFIHCAIAEAVQQERKRILGALPKEVFDDCDDPGCKKKLNTHWQAGHNRALSKVRDIIEPK